MRLMKPGLSSRASVSSSPDSTVDASGAQRLGAASVDLRVGVGDGVHHARHARRGERQRARRGAALVAARLERHVDGGAGGLRTGRAQRRHFRVRFPGALVPALTHDALAAGDDTAHARIRIGACAGRAPPAPARVASLNGRSQRTWRSRLLLIYLFPPRLSAGGSSVGSSGSCSRFAARLPSRLRACAWPPPAGAWRALRRRWISSWKASTSSNCR